LESAYGSTRSTVDARTDLMFSAAVSDVEGLRFGFGMDDWWAVVRLVCRDCILVRDARESRGGKKTWRCYRKGKDRKHLNHCTRWLVTHLGSLRSHRSARVRLRFSLSTSIRTTSSLLLLLLLLLHSSNQQPQIPRTQLYLPPMVQPCRAISTQQKEKPSATNITFPPPWNLDIYIKEGK
jgi:hypothetical protein